ncbi:aspartate racemase [Alkaliphilus peptidifermentans DSM 18978]|uniref:Aspartate racemase n=2 Tax=Alkaliphilus TaxID=114627 RepID=A0A1G5JN10_9FIRM|nr:aspartate racemase [Alkaliphilus peptidifermentans DSM 18978]
MGPEATANLFNKIINLTEANNDQEHIPIIIDNNVLIPDRTAYLLEKSTNPLKYLIKSAIKLELMGADLVLMPCNTAHYFYEDIIKYLDIPMLNMVDIATTHVYNNYKNVKRIGLLATMGTYTSRVYEDSLKRFDIEVVPVLEEDQKKLLDIIYSIKKGNKDNHKEAVYSILRYLSKNEVSVIILGCTELPILFDILKNDKDIIRLKQVYIDTTYLLAKKAVELASL